VLPGLFMPPETGQQTSKRGKRESDSPSAILASVQSERLSIQTLRSTNLASLLFQGGKLIEHLAFNAQSSFRA
jgi:hypothetical protein